MAVTSPEYDPAVIEPHWQDYWEKNHSFRACEGSAKPKYYILEMYPYPSGAGLHLGHFENNTAVDVLARYKKQRGFNVLRPMGWDAFGLPTEQAAIRTGVHPVETTRTNVANMKRQMKEAGWGIDWEREVNTTDPAYFKWTQWIFMRLFSAGLAYVDERPVWWCPALKTVLANEEVIDGRSERGNHPVERRPLRQWVLRITAYAEQLLEGLAGLQWPESTKRQQQIWIGRSEGAEITFPVDGPGHPELQVYTTRPDTLFGATYMVVAPEHPLLKAITVAGQRPAVEAYVERTASKSDLDRTDLAKEKSGVFTGSFAINPVNKARIPIWVADYVLMSYGTGAIMAVPAHDERDYAFARQYDLPIQQVIEKSHEGGDNGAPTDLPFTGEGILAHSNGYSGLHWQEAGRRITADLEQVGKGRAAVNYKLRDWLFSRQRYWGEPFPIVWVDRQAYERAATFAQSPVACQMPPEPVTYSEGGASWYALPLPSASLPVDLPPTDSYQPSDTGESPLANVAEWVQVFVNLKTGETVPAAGGQPAGDEWVRARRETNTMPQWAGSCWYYLRYMDPDNPDRLVAPEREAYWQNPDLYVGGAEHAVLHLLYARFWHRFLYDQGVVTTQEPFPCLFHQGIILGEDGNKMSKSLGNVVNPDDVIRDYGADTLRLYILFMGPLEDKKPWNPGGIEGVYRFLRKIWREFLDREGKRSDKVMDDPFANDEATERLWHETVKKVTADIESLRFNTAISQMMIFMNQVQKAPKVSRTAAMGLLQLVAPFAPHFAEEVWERLGGAPSILDSQWPSYDEAKLAASRVKVVFQVNGKVRGEAEVDTDAGQETVQAIAEADPRVASFIQGKTVRKVIYVPGRILNIVAH